MTTPQIRQAEATMLKSFLYSMPFPDRREFISRVVTRSRLPRRHFYNWQYACARIPTHVKHIIEREARQQIFVWTTEYNH